MAELVLTDEEQHAGASWWTSWRTGPGGSVCRTDDRPINECYSTRESAEAAAKENTHEH